MDDIHLPRSFRNVCVNDRIRANLYTIDDVDAWMREFQRDNSSIFYPCAVEEADEKNGVLQVRRICQFSPLLDEGKSIVFKCPAEIIIEITNEQDVYTRDGLPAIITFLSNHYHPSEAMKEIRNIFEKLFEHCMRNGEARTFYIKIMEDRLGRTIDEWAVPTKRTVKEWYESWLSNRAETLTASEALEELPVTDDKSKHINQLRN